MSTLVELRDRAKIRFRDTEQIFVDNDTWDEHLNAAYREFYQAARWPFRLTSTDYTLAAGERSIDLALNPPTAADVLEHLSDVYDVTGDRVLMPAPDPPNLPTRLRMFFEHQDSTPLFFNLSGDRLYVFPAPRGASPTDDHTIRVWYAQQDPAALALDADEPDMPDRYHEALVSGALHRAHADDANHEAVQAYRQEFESILQQAFAELRPKGVFHDALRDKEAERAGRAGGASA